MEIQCHVYHFSNPNAGTLTEWFEINLRRNKPRKSITVLNWSVVSSNPIKTSIIVSLIKKLNPHISLVLVGSSNKFKPDLHLLAKLLVSHSKSHIERRRGAVGSASDS